MAPDFGCDVQFYFSITIYESFSHPFTTVIACHQFQLFSDPCQSRVRGKPIVSLLCDQATKHVANFPTDFIKLKSVET